MPEPSTLEIRGARAHNLRDLDLTLPHDAMTVVSGVSGSGKSSLAVDCLLVEARRRYLGAVAGPALHRLGKLGRARVEDATGLRAGVLLGQSRPGGGPRSTVGTASGLLELLRLLLARVGQRACLSCGSRVDRLVRCPSCGQPADPLLAGSLSFNRAGGACSSCSGLGLVDEVDPALLVADERKGLRLGALVPTTPKPYIVYSQVTMEVLDTVCRAHGFTVDTPWEQLTDEQRAVVFYGSDRVVVPFGKHPIESRMRWSGITARPREEGHYKGIITTIQGILSQKRNPGVLRFVRSVPCGACGGSRLSPQARAVSLGGRDIHGWSRLTMDELGAALSALELGPRQRPVAAPLVDALASRVGDLRMLGLGHVDLARSTDSLSGGEARRMQLAGCIAGGLSRMLYVLDEPSAGLHPREIARARAVLERLRSLGNTVVLVEHEPLLVDAADWLVEIGPGAGAAGGRKLYEGPPAARVRQDPVVPPRGAAREPRGRLRVLGAQEHNLKRIDVSIPTGCLVGIAGVSGAGKTTLAVGTIARALSGVLGNGGPPPGRHQGLEGADSFAGVEVVDATPIGRSPRSNAATYTKLFDGVRKLYAAQPGARERGFGAARFSFNTAGGRCERCEGAGSLKVGMHFLPDVHLLCPTCQGRRFDADTLSVRFRGRSIHDVLESSVAEALVLFHDQPAIVRVLQALDSVGLGYLPLGQPATALSGGEARRVKLAAHLARPPRGTTLYVLDEPSVGLHQRDVAVLAQALVSIVENGHTVLVVDHDRGLLEACDHLIMLGPGGGAEGGQVVGQGCPRDVLAPIARTAAAAGPRPSAPGPRAIELRAVRTHNLRAVDLELPHDALTVITGVSGSGKSSLAFDTLHAEAWRRFGSTLPGDARRRLARLPRPDLGSATGLAPSVAVGQRTALSSPRSVVGSVAGVLPALRLLWSRFGQRRCPSCGAGVEGDACVGCGAAAPVLTAGHFSFNRELGACPACGGLGTSMACDPQRLVSHPERSLWEGAMEGSRLGRYLGEPHGQHMATLAAVGEGLGLELRLPWRELSPGARRVALEGTGERVWSVRWSFVRGRRVGEHSFEGPWPGLLSLVEEAWHREHASRRGRDIEPLMARVPCVACDGTRLSPWPRGVQFGGWGFAGLCALPVADLGRELRGWRERPRSHGLGDEILAGTHELRDTLERAASSLQRLGLGYLSLDRRSDTLSGGEARRVQLAGLLSSGLVGLCCVLDEPSMGLHPRDTQALLAELRRLVAEGNTVVVVEHDLDIIRTADHVVELGPGAGLEGGRVVAQGAPDWLEAQASSLTGAWLRGAARLPARVPAALEGEPLRLLGVTRHNLRDLDVSIPTGGLVGIAGVSGSGKSTLVNEVLAPSFGRRRAVHCRALLGGELFQRVVTADSRPIGSSPISTPASFVGMLPLIAARFAASPDAAAAGLGRATFSYTSPKGRCPACKGLGREAVGLELLADAWLPCEDCGGSRYRSEALQVRVAGLNVAEVLALRVDRVAQWIGDEGGLAGRAALLTELGLGYLRLDQAASSLSGGESRRLRLAAALLEPAPEGARSLFLLDEPCAGLHPGDVATLLGVLDGLVAQGHTVVVVEHHAGLLSRCDHIVELGPEGGPGGGRIVAQGSPAEIVAAATPTGSVLAAP